MAPRGYVSFQFVDLILETVVERNEGKVIIPFDIHVLVIGKQKQ